MTAVDRTGWADVRQVVLARDGFRCQDCGHDVPDELDVHHLVPRAYGGGDEPSNLVLLCDGCHAARHPNLQASLSRRMIERWAIRLARILDRDIPDDVEALPVALRLLGKDSLREGQLEAVLTALRGDSMLVVRPTGSGKTLCFQLPTLLSPGTTFVLSPLKALMADQTSELQRIKLPGTFINSDLGPDEKEARYELLEHQALKFLYCTPERFNPNLVRPEEVARIVKARPSFLVVDEAHCVDRWGLDFRPDYARVGEIRRALGNPPVLAFTATAGAKAQTRILESLGAPEADVLIADANRPNISLCRHNEPDITRRAEIITALLRGLGDGRAMIFVPTVKKGEEVRSALRACGLDVPFYHSKMGTANERDVILGRFTGRLSPPLNVVICTNAFGMGIDVPNVRLVVHWQHPASVEDYLQEFGRAGRDGRRSLALLFTNGDRDAGLLRFMAEKTVEKARLSPKDRQAALNIKLEQIDEMNYHALNQRACFRRSLLRSLQGDRRRPRRSLSSRILAWAFTGRARRARKASCCDACSMSLRRKVVEKGLLPR